MPQKQFIAMDWQRRPQNEREEAFAGEAFLPVLEFMRSMASVRARYDSPDARNSLGRASNAIVLNAFDGYLTGTAMVADPELLTEEASSLCGFDWEIVSRAISALEVVKLVSTAALEGPHDIPEPPIEVCLDGVLAEQAVALKAELLDHSQPLNVHTSSNHPEVKVFVDQIYAAHFTSRKVEILKRHIKVVLLDLYVRWTVDPSLKTAFARNANMYVAGSRYNALHISKLTIKVVDILEAAGLIHQTIGFFDRDKQSGKQTRIWPTVQLIAMFEEAKFGPSDIEDHPDREVIIQREPHPTRKNTQVDKKYNDTADTNRMREQLRAYNALISDTFIDIPTLDTPFIELERSTQSRPAKLLVNQRDKLTRRIFSRGSFDKGGRFYGGWWQRCPKDWRAAIFMNDQPVTEVDYSGLHMVMLYANKGIDYWTKIGTDPYEVTVAAYGPDPVPRSICKLLTLVAVNAKDATTACQAFRYEAETRSDEKRMKDKMLLAILDGLKAKHAPIADMFANDAGIDLMNQDSRITELVLKWFTDEGVPVLPIHDSYIVPLTVEAELIRQMEASFAKVMGKGNVKLKQEIPNPWDYESSENTGGFASAAWETAVQYRFDPPRSARYLQELKRFTAFQAELGQSLGDWRNHDYDQ